MAPFGLLQPVVSPGNAVGAGKRSLALALAIQSMNPNGSVRSMSASISLRRKPPISSTRRPDDCRPLILRRPNTICWVSLASVPWDESYNVYWASLRDPSGALWVTRDDREGITRVRWKSNESPISEEEHFGKAAGLSGEIGRVYFMDREANIWVATEQGIDRFSMGKFTPVIFPGNMTDLTIAADHSGGLWVGSLREKSLYLKDEAPPVPTGGLGPGSDCSMVDSRRRRLDCRIHRS